MNSSNNPPAPARSYWAWLVLILAGITIYLGVSGQLTPLLSKLPSTFTLGTARTEPHWWEGKWVPANGTAVPWIQLAMGRDDAITGQFVQEGTSQGWQYSLAIHGGEYRPPDTLLLAVEKAFDSKESVSSRTQAATQFFLLTKRPGGSAELFALRSLPPGELHLSRPGKMAGPIYFPADPENSHQRIAILTQRPVDPAKPNPPLASKENQHE